jgi:hypothetical protein
VKLIYARRAGLGIAGRTDERSRRIVMKKTLLVVGTLAGLVVAAGVASAGPCTTEIEALQKQMSSTDAGMGPTGAGTVKETGTMHPPTETMTEATEGKAASPGDVASQNVGEPTDADAAQSGEFGTSPAPVQAEASLERARQFDQSGDEAACMKEIEDAKKHLGIQ